MWQENTLGGTPVNHRAPCAHQFSPRSNWSSQMGGTWSKLKQGELAQKFKKVTSNLGLNGGPWQQWGGQGFWFTHCCFVDSSTSLPSLKHVMFFYTATNGWALQCTLILWVKWISSPFYALYLVHFLNYWLGMSRNKIYYLLTGYEALYDVFFPPTQ